MSRHELESDEGSATWHLQPLCAGDPSQRFVYSEPEDGRVAQWFSSRRVSRSYAAPDHIISFETHYLVLMCPKWIKDSRSLQMKRCLDVCTITLDHQSIARGLLRAHLREGRDMEITESTDAIESDAYFLHLFRAIDFCATVIVRQSNNSEPAFPPFAWPPIYNGFFEVTRGDCFSDIWKFLNIEYAPKWSLAAGQDAFCSSDLAYIIPDTVFILSVSEPKVGAEHRSRLHQFRMEYQWNDHYGHIGAIRIPLLIVEYVKTSISFPNGEEQHLNHLLMAMTSALGLYRTLHISKTVPILGLVVNRYRGTLYLAWRNERSCEVNHEFPILRCSECHLSDDPDTRFTVEYKILKDFDFWNGWDCLQLRLLILELLQHREVVFEAVENSRGLVLQDIQSDTLYKWRQSGPLERLRYIDGDPPSHESKPVVEDWLGSMRLGDDEERSS